MTFYVTRGKIPHKRHVAFWKDPNRKEVAAGIYFEELMGNKGFVGASSLIYHIHRPTTVTAQRVVKPWVLEADPDPAARMRHFFCARMPKGGTATLDRHPVLFNRDVTMSMAHPSRDDAHYYRNAQADELIYVSDGGGVLESQMGNLAFRKGDYVVIPRGILHRWKFTDIASDPPRLVVFECRGEVRTPKRYRNEHGQHLEHAPYCERDFRVPDELPVFDEKGEFAIIVKQHNLFHEFTLDHHPLDVVGWDGFYYPWAFNIEDFEPIVGRVHQPPPVHQTFEADGLVICSFVPRLYDFHPEAVPAPYHHANVMSDEVLYYAKDKFMSRKGIEYGSVTLHPDGLVHGPHPGRAEASVGQKMTDELAVMCDTFEPLKVALSALEVEDNGYYRSWLEV